MKHVDMSRGGSPEGSVFSRAWARKRQKGYNTKLLSLTWAPGSIPWADVQHRMGGGRQVRGTRAVVSGCGLNTKGQRDKGDCKVWVGDAECHPFRSCLVCPGKERGLSQRHLLCHRGLYVFTVKMKGFSKVAVPKMQRNDHVSNRPSFMQMWQV